MSYALINTDGTLNSTTSYDSFVWRGLTLTAVSRLSHQERVNIGIYDYAQKFQEIPEGKKQCGFTQEINHEEGIVYEIPVFIDKSPAEITAEQITKYKEEIAKLEGSVTPRRSREAILTEEGKNWLIEVEAAISDLRDKLAALPKPAEE